ncbi:hypothetical protein FN846DRAFT_918720 [Sphaerosporella brunnea]|uniref:Conidiation protein 6-domain-containing protein n=1 Tax=Sphaerosporella brunnea TaxID=1250544 RepID=A0A5J5EZ36_9PEZI|nr:hypothetical protein FN846DRAFT_918720 [Sphaerosporella brunnea]
MDPNVSHHDLRSEAQHGQTQGASGSSHADAMETEHIHHVIAGHKANLSNPNTSVESKVHSRRVLEEIARGELTESREEPESEPEPSVAKGPPPHQHTIHHHGAMPKQSDIVHPGDTVVAEDPGHGETVIIEEKRVRNVISGYKAALRNPRVGAAAKQRAQEVLDELERD